MEVPVLNALPPQTLAAVRCLVAECDGRQLNLPDARYEQYLSIARFTRPVWHAAALL